VINIFNIIIYIYIFKFFTFLYVDKLKFLGDDRELFTAMLYKLYVTHDRFYLDAFCNNNIILVNPKLHRYNVTAKVIV